MSATDGRSAAFEAFNADAILDRAVASAGIGAWTCTLEDSALSWTSGVYELFGLSPTDRLNRCDVVALYDEESRIIMERLRTDAITHARPFTVEAQIIRPNGTRRWIRLNADVMQENGRTTRLFGLKQDITEEKQRWETLRQLAEHDALTGLTSRAVYQNLFLNAPRAQPGITPLGAMVLIDLDGFKRINDRFGHATGDVCLRVVAERLKAAFPNAPMIARIGGDEFVLLVDTHIAPLTLERRVARLLVDISQPIIWRTHCLIVGASAGIAPVADPHLYDAGALFVMADEALYAAKAAGRGAVRMSGARTLGAGSAFG